jgi:signal peptidase I
MVDHPADGPDDAFGQAPEPHDKHSIPNGDPGFEQDAPAVDRFSNQPLPQPVGGEPAFAFMREEAQQSQDSEYFDSISSDAYTDVPASLELEYVPADVGLSPRAYDRAIPYERVERRRRGARGRKIARELVETIILALLIFFAVRAVVQNFRVEGASMEPSMHNRDYLLVNKAIYYRLDMGRLNEILPFLPGDESDGESHLFRPPRRGDVVVFRFPLDPDRDFIKRVIGVPGDVVEIKNEKVYVNNVELVENYILATSNYTYGPKEVPEGMYFVLGDNRRNSYDSHAWGSGCGTTENCEFVPEENIIGQAWVTYWPWEDLGLVNNKDIQAP